MASLPSSKYASLSKLLQVTTHIDSEQWTEWLNEDLDNRLARQHDDTSLSTLLADDEAFRMEMEDSVSSVLWANEKFSEEKVAHVCSVVRVFLSELYHLKKKKEKETAMKKKEKKKGQGSSSSSSLLSSSLSDSSSSHLLSTMEVSLRVTEWINDQIPNGIVCHELPSSFLSRVINSEHLSEMEAIDEILTKDMSRKLFKAENAGGTSELSEAVSLEILSDLMIGCELLLSEMEIEYLSGSRKTDYCISAGASRVTVGVSVTRAMEFQAEFGEDEALALLQKKLMGICESTKAVQSKMKWTKQILHILASEESAAVNILNAYEDCDDSLKSNTLIVVTTCPSASSSMKGHTLLERIFYSESSAASRHHTVNIGKVKSVFNKELAAKMKIKISEVGSSDFELSDSILSCCHTLQGDKIGGPQCLVCGFPTSKRVWKCTNGCGLTLCGSCAWKWKDRLG